MDQTIKIEVDGDLVAKKVLEAIANSSIQRVISAVMGSRGINEDQIGLEFDRAAEQVAKEIFVDHLRNSIEFKAKLRTAITAKLTDAHIKTLIKNVLQRVY